MKRSTRPSALLAASVLALSGMMAQPALAQKSVDMDDFRAQNAELYQKLSFADLVERVSPAVVSIRTSREVPVGRGFDGLPPELERLLPGLRDQFGGRSEGETRRAFGEGSGFFIDDKGHIVTNNHVIEGAQDITVVLNSGEELEAELVGTDPETDLAVLKVEPSPKQRYVTFAPKPELRVGDYVLAVGNPFGLGGTVTSGIVSALDRDSGLPYSDFIQIDASINRGNSGGPTFDVKGNVIGVNTAIISPTGVNAGIGLAIPSDVASRVVKEIIENGGVSRGFLGVSIRDPEPQILEAVGLEEGAGALIANVTEGSPAEKAGLLAGDIVTELEGQKISSADELTRRVGSYPPGTRVKVTAFRDGKERTFTVKLEKRDLERLAGNAGGSDSDQSEETERLGVSFRALDESTRRRLGVSEDVDGVLIADVERDSEAAAAGILPGMIVMEADNKKVTSPRDIEKAVEAAKKRDRGAILLRVQTRQGLDFRALPINS
ncbi:Do family serine endopeptidase [Parvularcula lutaonensis]|uniref:Do family serine endopeptidase n=1 Tax=Parvularcula lutaonensis TaxID=491923 RepID=A0ABV7MFA6_9PROT|nr:Do family serine endopeptidase [Parvularcula lutaonensis]GGY53274.1 serine peptidase [Parvularcula lutaonensis]